MARARAELRDARDRLVASDPGLGRLWQATRAVLGVGTTLGVELGLARLVGAPPALAMLLMLLGAIVAMLVSTGVSEPTRAATLRTLSGVPVAASLGTALGVLTSPHHLLGLTSFVAVSFVAVWIRRFGPRWFTYGFLAWQGFFFALFLHPPLAALPLMVLAIVVATVWVGLLLLTVLRADPQARLRRTVVALRARARAGISALIDVLDDPGSRSALRRLRRQLVQLSEIALLLDGQMSDPHAVPPGMRPGQVRRWAVDIEIGMDEAAAAVVDLAKCKDDLAPELLAEVRHALESLGWGETAQARRWVETLEASTGPQLPAVLRLAWAASYLLGAVDRWDSGRLDVAGAASGADGVTTTPGVPQGADPDPLDEADSAFESVVTLFAGNLPGSALVASNVLEEGAGSRRWWSAARLSLTSRQAVQAALAAALAIVAGEAISPKRFYWAAIAAFIAFTGASNAGETVRRSVARVAGTLAGLGGAIVLSGITLGHPAAALASLFACIFLAFYLQQLSYAAMIFFITLMLGQLYTLLHTFTDAVLVVRLEETAAGALIGVLVSLLVLPTGTRATARAARSGFLRQLADLLDGCAGQLERTGDADVLALVVGLDAWGRQVVRTYRSVARGGLFGVDRTGLRHRLSVLGACGAHARALAAVVTAQPPAAQASPVQAAAAQASALAAACRVLAGRSRQLADLRSLAVHGAPAAAFAASQQQVTDLLERGAADRASRPTRVAIGRLNDALALLTAA